MRIENLLASLKRVFERPSQPSAESIGEPTADRPPPNEPAPSASPPLESPPPASPPPASPPSVLAPTPEPAPQRVTPTVDGISEVRAAFEALAEPPAVVPEATAEVPPEAPEPMPTFAPPIATPLFPPAAEEEESVDVPNAAPARAGDALVLTLATPAAIFTVAKSAATLGRGQENTIRLDDLSVSRRHARIAYRQGGYWLSDLGSMGGTWVNGTRLNAPLRIAAGEVIDIGLCRLTVSFTGGAAIGATKKNAKSGSEMATQVRRRR